MTTLHFRAEKATAVKHLVNGTSLGLSTYLRCWDIPVHDGSQVTVTWHNGLWSSGEEVLLDLLESIAGRTSGFAVCDMHKLDEETRLVALEAIGLCYGITVKREEQDA